MTVGAKVKQTVASLKGVEASLHQLYLHADTLKPLYMESISTIRGMIGDLEQRVALLEAEEPQYKGF